MTSEEYILQVERLMNLQNTYTGIWIALTGLFLAGVLSLQYLYNKKQVEVMKAEAKKETIDMICKVLDIDDLNDLRKNLTEHNQLYKEFNEDFYDIIQSHIDNYT